MSVLFTQIWAISCGALLLPALSEDVWTFAQTYNFYSDWILLKQSFYTQRKRLTNANLYKLERMDSCSSLPHRAFHFEYDLDIFFINVKMQIQNYFGQI